MSASLPTIEEAHVSLIRPIVLPSLLSKGVRLKPEFSFLGSLNEYSQYYMEFEGGRVSTTPEKGKRFAIPSRIPELGPLEPLKRRHAMNSYWKTFRGSIDKAKEQGKIRDELFLLLPLVTAISVRPVTVNGENFAARIRVYLFPFGCCSINLDLRIVDKPFDKFLDIVPKLNASTLTRFLESGQVEIMGSFKKFSSAVSRLIGKALFGESGDERQFSTHTLIFISRTSALLSDQVRNHKVAIAALMRGRTYEDTSTLGDDDLDRCLSGKLEHLRSGEILLVSPNCSFLHPSREWARGEKNRNGSECMRRNYEYFLSMMFAVNRTLKDCLTSDGDKIDPQRSEQIKKGLAIAFPEDMSTIYLKHAFKHISTSIRLGESLKDVGTWSR